MKSHRIAVIPARGGSKRIPQKNIKEFCGKPIIVWSIEAALASACFDSIVVSTDDEKIARIARQAGAKVPFIRPANLADDHTGTVPVIAHAIRTLEVEESPQFVCCIYATAPFVTPEDLQAAWSLFDRGEDVDYTVSVTSYAFPIQRALKKTKQGRIAMFNPEFETVRSQDLEEAFHDAGQFYWGRTSAWLNHSPLFGERSLPYVMPSYRVQDIDTLEDWKRAELMFESLQQCDKNL